MFTFEQFCNHATVNKLLPYFEVEKFILDSLTPEEKSLVIIEHLEVADVYRCWYPKGKWYESPHDIFLLKEQLYKALEENDFVKASQIKKRIEKQKEKETK